MPTATLPQRRTVEEGATMPMPFSAAEEDDYSSIVGQVEARRTHVSGSTGLEPGTADIIFVRDELPVSVYELKALEQMSHALPDPDEVWRRPRRRHYQIQASLQLRPRQAARLPLDVGIDTEH